MRSYYFVITHKRSGALTVLTKAHTIGTQHTTIAIARVVQLGTLPLPPEHLKQKRRRSSGDAMIKIIPVVLSAGILVLQWKLFASAFSTTASTVGVKTSWPSTLSSRVLVTIYANTRGDVISADEERSVDASDVEDKAAVIFLHGLGDSPDGWASLADALPDLRPSLADLNITYVFPPANTVAITVNGGEKMPGVFEFLSHSSMMHVCDFISYAQLNYIYFFDLQGGSTYSIGQSAWTRRMIPKVWQCP